MADTAYVIPADSLDIRVSGRKITDFPATGTFMTIEKVTPLSTPVEGRNRTVTFVRNPSAMHRVTLTLMQFHPDDVFMAAAIKAMHETDSVLAFSFKLNGTVYTSGAMDIETAPNRELASDGVPSVAYPLVGNFPIAILGAFQQPTTLTEADITPFIP